jgi:AcrR family transcriptional regulator
MTTLTKRREGRPRSEEAHRAILEATNRILQRTSVRDLTIESIAKEAGVGKPTIYRWWPNKAAVVMDAFFDTMSPHMDYPQADTVADSLKAQLHQVLRLTRGKQGLLMAEILAEGQSDPIVLESFRKRFLEIRRAAARALIRHGQVTGEISRKIDVELAIDLIYSPIYHRLLAGHLPLADSLADDLVDWAFAGLSPRRK